MFRRNVLSEWAETLIATGRLRRRPRSSPTTRPTCAASIPPPRSRRPSGRRGLLLPLPGTRPAQSGLPRGARDPRSGAFAVPTGSHAARTRRGAPPCPATRSRQGRPFGGGVDFRWAPGAALACSRRSRTGANGPSRTRRPPQPTEQQIADLVAADRTNREVAEALFMSPHTVEAHLTRVYQSLRRARPNGAGCGFARASRRQPPGVRIGVPGISPGVVRVEHRASELRPRTSLERDAQ